MNQELFQGKQVRSTRILHTPSDWATSSLLYLQETGHLEALEPHTSSHSGLDSYLLFLVTEGSGKLFYDGFSYSLKAGDCAFVDCHKKYSHTCSANLWHLSWVHFSGPTMTNIYFKFFERNASPVFHTSDIATYQTIFSNLYQVASSISYTQDIQICECLTTLLALAMTDGWSPEQRRNDPREDTIRHIREYIDTHFKEHITLDALAAQFYIDKYFMVHLFKSTYDISIINYAIQKKVEHAKKLLRFSNYSIGEIATMCGFEDANYFTRLFTKIEHTSPSAYRKSWNSI